MLGIFLTRVGHRQSPPNREYRKTAQPLPYRIQAGCEIMLRCFRYRLRPHFQEIECFFTWGPTGSHSRWISDFRVRVFTPNSRYSFLINNTNQEYLEILYTNALQYRRGSLVARMEHTYS